MTTFTGTIKFFIEEKGFGFITPDAGGKDVFLHITNFTGGGVGDIPQEGQAVTYQVGLGKKGKEEALGVKWVAAAPKVDDTVFGTVKFFNWDADKLYGFVQVSGLSKDVFLHISQLTGLLDEEKVLVGKGTELVFTLKRGKKGYYVHHASLVKHDNVVTMKWA